MTAVTEATMPTVGDKSAAAPAAGGIEPEHKPPVEEGIKNSSAAEEAVKEAVKEAVEEAVGADVVHV